MQQLLDGKTAEPMMRCATVFAPANIALAKYWGKKNIQLNVPVTSSLSISLGHLGAKTTLKISTNTYDTIVLNDKGIALTTPFAQRLCAYLDLVRAPGQYFNIDTTSSVPVAAGLASSACGFAAMALALNQLFAWQLPVSSLSVLARLGSGSAARSLWQGFVQWQVGERVDGLDSYAYPIASAWPQLRLGLLLISDKVKQISSRDAMLHTVETSVFYQQWPATVASDLSVLRQAIDCQDFDLLGKTAEANAMAMHSLMLCARPAICYHLPQTLEMMQQVWALRRDGIAVYFTQDAGPNLKLLFLKKDLTTIQSAFSNIVTIAPFDNDHPTPLAKGFNID